MGVNCTHFRQPRFCIREEVNNLHELAEQGSKQAQYRLGIMYVKGIVIQQSDREAIYFFTESAEQGYAPSQYELARLNFKYAMLSAEEEDQQKLFEKAFFWYKAAAEGNYIPSQVAVALMYIQGLGVEQNDTEAIYWCRKAVDFAGPLALQNDDLVSQCKIMLSP